MFCNKSLDEIRKELSPLRKYWVVLYGSCVYGESTPRSDIDVAIITRIKSIRENLEIFKDVLGSVKPCYDVRIFELLPLNIKISVIEKYVVVFGDPLEISEYFYTYRKIWKDAKRRYMLNKFKSFKEKLEGIERRKKLLSWKSR
ncbi:MAG: nucleotidyltransferase domain-containing protein [Candidatus Njordarchaeia archaeon]